MTQFFDRWGIATACTVVHVDRNQITEVYTLEKNGFNAMSVGFGEKKLKKVTKSYAGQFLKYGLPPKEKIFTFKCTPENFLPPGFFLGPRHF